MKNPLLLLFPFFLLIIACESPAGDQGSTEMIDENPPAPGFNIDGSDPEAVALADSVMVAMGGRQAWDNTRYIGWNFFGARHLVWDKQTGQVRIEIPADSSVFLVDIDDTSGKVRLHGENVSNQDTLQKYLSRAKSIWINDAYWLVMPYKLKDSGVTLAYQGRDTTQTGAPAEVIRLTFENVGDTPQNKYLVYIDPESHLVTQWQYFPKASDTEPAFTTPWQDYREYGGILLSGDRGQRQLTDIKVYDNLPGQVFESLEPVNLD